MKVKLENTRTNTSKVVSVHFCFMTQAGKTKIPMDVMVRYKEEGDPNDPVRTVDRLKGNVYTCGYPGNISTNLSEMPLSVFDLARFLYYELKSLDHNWGRIRPTPNITSDEIAYMQRQIENYCSVHNVQLYSQEKNDGV